MACKFLLIHQALGLGGNGHQPISKHPHAQGCPYSMCSQYEDLRTSWSGRRSWCSWYDAAWNSEDPCRLVCPVLDLEVMPSHFVTWRTTLSEFSISSGGAALKVFTGTLLILILSKRLLTRSITLDTLARYASWKPSMTWAVFLTAAILLLFFIFTTKAFRLTLQGNMLQCQVQYWHYTFSRQTSPNNVKGQRVSQNTKMEEMVIPSQVQSMKVKSTCSDKFVQSDYSKSLGISWYSLV